MAFLENLLPSLVPALVTLGLGWLISNRISATWAIRQKRRELELEANTQFYQLYGEFFAIWKLWNYSVGSPDPMEILNPMETLRGRETLLPEQIRWSLLERAMLAEGKVEALLVKLASERDLSAGGLKTLGLFRQGYQQLHKAIAKDIPLDWWGSEVPEYIAFKRLACQIAYLLVSDKRRLANAQSHIDALPGKMIEEGPYNAGDALLEITSNYWEDAWKELRGTY